MEGVSSAHADELGDDPHGDTVGRVLGHGRVHGPVDVDRDLDLGIIGDGLDGAVSAGEDVDHELRGTPFLGILRQLPDVLSVGADVDGVDHVVALLPQPVKGLGDGLGTVLDGAERLVHQGLVVLAVGEPSASRLVDVLGGVLGRESDLGLHDGADQGFLGAVQDLPQSGVAELGSLVLPEDALGELHVLQPDALEGAEAVEVAGDDREDLGDRAHLDAEICFRESYGHHVAVDGGDLGGIVPEHLVVEGRDARPGTGRLLRGDGLRRFLHGEVRGHTVFAHDVGIPVDLLAQCHIGIAAHLITPD